MAVRYRCVEATCSCVFNVHPTLRQADILKMMCGLNQSYYPGFGRFGSCTVYNIYSYIVVMTMRHTKNACRIQIDIYIYCRLTDLLNMNIIVQNNYITHLISYFENVKTYYIMVTTVVLLIDIIIIS